MRALTKNMKSIFIGLNKNCAKYFRPIKWATKPGISVNLSKSQTKLHLYTQDKFDICTSALERSTDFVTIHSSIPVPGKLLTLPSLALGLRLRFKLTKPYGGVGEKLTRNRDWSQSTWSFKSQNKSGVN